MRTLSEIRTNLRNTTRETQINDTIDEFINLTLQEINNPSWATDGYDHSWSFNRRKDTITTVTDTEFYVLPRDLDKISIIRQTESPTKLKFLTDDVFYKRVPYPTATGNPLYYRIWEEEGVAVRLSTADTLSVVSSSTADGSSISIAIVGYDSNDIKRSETINLNGTTAANGTITFSASRPLRISKSANTTGTITIKEKTAGTTLLTIGEYERSPRFKVIGFYPLPSSAISIYLEYFTRIRRVEHDAEVPDIDEKWIWVVRLGALAKIRDYQNKPNDAAVAYGMYKAGVQSMVKSDLMIPDNLPTLKRNYFLGRAGIVELSDDNYSAWF